MSRSIYWFRNDLRLGDNEALINAIEESNEIIPVYILDESWLNKKQFGIERMGAFRLKFLLESLEELKSELKLIGSDLIFSMGNTSLELKRIKNEFGCNRLFAQKASAFEETSLEKEVQEEIDSCFIWGETLYHLDDLPISIHDLPDTFTTFRKQVEKKAEVREEFDAPLAINSPQDFGTEIPKMADLGYDEGIQDERAVLHFKGGAKAGLERLQYYLWDKELLSTYKKTRNGLIGGDYSSKFSPWLSLGCLSPKQIYWQIKKFEKYIIKNSSTYWLVFELIWRDYFHFVALKYGHKIYRRSGISGNEKIQWKSDKLFHLWRDGKTKEPFVDANMREMNNTGFMSNRGRQIVASYLMHTMSIDWRLGAAYFEKMLIDYDPCSNYGNWIYIAGVGNDPRGGREFNISRQRETYDPQGDYQELWSI